MAVIFQLVADLFAAIAVSFSEKKETNKVGEDNH